VHRIEDGFDAGMFVSQSSLTPAGKPFWLCHFPFIVTGSNINASLSDRVPEMLIGCIQDPAPPYKSPRNDPTAA